MRSLAARSFAPGRQLRSEFGVPPDGGTDSDLMMDKADCPNSPVRRRSGSFPRLAGCRFGAGGTAPNHRSHHPYFFRCPRIAARYSPIAGAGKSWPTPFNTTSSDPGMASAVASP